MWASVPPLILAASADCKKRNDAQKQLAVFRQHPPPSPAAVRGYITVEPRSEAKLPAGYCEIRFCHVLARDKHLVPGEFARVPVCGGGETRETMLARKKKNKKRLRENEPRAQSRRRKRRRRRRGNREQKTIRGFARSINVEQRLSIALCSSYRKKSKKSSAIYVLGE